MIGIVLFGVFLLALIILDIVMIISLIKLGVIALIYCITLLFFKKRYGD